MNHKTRQRDIAILEQEIKLLLEDKASIGKDRFDRLGNLYGQEMAYYEGKRDGTLFEVWAMVIFGVILGIIFFIN